MNIKDGKKHLLFLSIMIFLVIFDQITKLIVIKKIAYQDVIEIIPSILDFTYVINTGAGFSLFKDFTLFLTIISIVFIVILGYFYFNNNGNNYEIISIILLLSGAFGNLIDRIFRKGVVDFISIGWWPTFNLADSFITIGAIIYIYLIIFDNIKIPLIFKKNN
jgi:signal peptidase II